MQGRNLRVWGVVAAGLVAVSGCSSMPVSSRTTTSTLSATAGSVPPAATTGADDQSGPTTETPAVPAQGESTTPAASADTSAASGQTDSCPVEKNVLRQALRNSVYESRLYHPIELEDQIDCAGGWAMAHNGTHGGTRERTKILYHYTNSTWEAIAIGTGEICTGVPAEVASQICYR